MGALASGSLRLFLLAREIALASTWMVFLYSHVLKRFRKIKLKDTNRDDNYTYIKKW